MDRQTVGFLALAVGIIGILRGRRPVDLGTIEVTGTAATSVPQEDGLGTVPGIGLPDTATNRALAAEAADHDGPPDWLTMGWPSPCGPSNDPARHCPESGPAIVVDTWTGKRTLEG